MFSEAYDSMGLGVDDSPMVKRINRYAINTKINIGFSFVYRKAD
ncbi:hypothetical protein [Tissierella carlieri]|nr:hypothetical protein [Tissierella carlieri]